MEIKQNSGSFFKNDYKKAENQPDFKGKVNIEGKELEIAIWQKKAKNGVEYYSCTFQPPYIKNEVKTDIKEVKNDFVMEDVKDDFTDLPF